MFPVLKSSTDHINDLITFAGNLGVACQLCGRVETTVEISKMHKILERQMIAHLRKATELLSDLEEREISNTGSQNSEPSPTS